MLGNGGDANALLHDAGWNRSRGDAIRSGAVQSIPELRTNRLVQRDGTIHGTRDRDRSVIRNARDLDRLRDTDLAVNPDRLSVVDRTSTLDSAGNRPHDGPRRSAVDNTANRNDAARAVDAHHFARNPPRDAPFAQNLARSEVPHADFARDVSLDVRKRSRRDTQRRSAQTVRHVDIGVADSGKQAPAHGEPRIAAMQALQLTFATIDDDMISGNPLRSVAQNAEDFILTGEVGTFHDSRQARPVDAQRFEFQHGIGQRGMIPEPGCDGRSALLRKTFVIIRTPVGRGSGSNAHRTERKKRIAAKHAQRVEQRRQTIPVTAQRRFERRGTLTEVDPNAVRADQSGLLGADIAQT